MRYLALLLAAVGGLLTCGRPAAAFEKAFQSGSWEGTAYYRGDGAVSICSARTLYENGLSLSIALRPAGPLTLLVIGPTGIPDYQARKIFYTGLYADGNLVHSGFGMTESRGRILRIDVPRSKETMRNLEEATSLRISSSDREIVFSLNGSRSAIAELQLCAAKGARSTANEEDEPLRTVDRDTLISYATEILEKAGFTDYRFLPQPLSGNPDVLVWKYSDGTEGSLAASERTNASEVDRSVAHTVAVDLAKCAGMFASGGAASDVQKTVIRKVFASCDAGERSFYAEYAFVRIPAGLLVKASAIVQGQNAPLGKGSRFQSAFEMVAQQDLTVLTKH